MFGCIIATLVVMIPELDFLLGPCTLLFGIPLIVLVPIIGMTTDPSWSPVLCAALLAYFPVLILFVVGLRNVPLSVMSFAASAGAAPLKLFSKVRLRYALPGLAAGFYTVIPLAFLGSMLGELTGARWGLGAYLIAIMAQANPTKEWGIFLVSAAITAGASWLCTLLMNALGLTKAPITAGIKNFGSKQRLLLGVIASIFIWEVAARWVSNPYFVKTPTQILTYSLQLSSPEVRSLFQAAGYTFVWSLAGLTVGVITGFLCALLLDIFTVFRPVLLSVVLVTQAVPIIALVPMYVSIFGRGAAATLAITTSAIFFPCFASIYEGLQHTPGAMVDFAQSTGASVVSVLSRVRIPAATPFIFAAVRLAAPRVLLGVTLAEYLATRRGLGAVLFDARGTLNFNVIWAIALLTGGASLVFTELVEYFERKSFSKYWSNVYAL